MSDTGPCGLCGRTAYACSVDLNPIDRLCDSCDNAWDEWMHSRHGFAAGRNPWQWPRLSWQEAVR